MDEHQVEKIEKNSVEPENLRVEYEALSNFYSTTVSFRLTLLGFYLATVGLIAGSEPRHSKLVDFLGILITVALYLFELRTRIIFHKLGQRGVQIEQVNWKFQHLNTEFPFFSRQFPEYLKLYNSSFQESSYADRIKILGLIPVRWITHSLSLDILYIGMLAFFILSVGIR